VAVIPFRYHPACCKQCREKKREGTDNRETGDGHRRKLIAGKQTDTDEEGLEERPSGAEDRNRWL